MNTFLQLVADSLFQRYGSNMSRLTMVFPGKRASLFFNQALSELSPIPVWAPRYMTISELFQQASDYSLCDIVESVCRLYQAYVQHIDQPQNLDQFYGWGEILLADFDDVDKHLVDAHQLFTNIRDIKALDDNSFITADQEKALRAFFSDFSLEENTLLKERFLALWNKMSQIYDTFNESLRHDGLLYEGALQRDVVVRLRQTQFDDDATLFNKQMTYVFVGFNVLNDVEQALFDVLQKRGQALFYWDYDLFYADPRSPERHEAGHFIRLNVERYGNELSAECFDNMKQPKLFSIVAATSENAQARYLPQWLAQNLTEQENQTAVVLCNEQLLQPVMHSIPDEVEALNVTMGYPLTDTPVSSFVNVLLSLQTDGYDATHHRFRLSALRAVANHPFIIGMDESVWKRKVGSGSELLVYLLELLKKVGQRYSDTSILYAEAVFVAYTRINRLLDLMTGDAPLLDVRDTTLRHLVNVMLQSVSVPFHGEPAIGLQVMGVLETRALDFKHILMLSVGEGYLPKNTSETSFIPYHLKEAFGLTTIKHKIAVYAYYFYRLIQRAERVTFVYNDSNIGIRQNEISRFLRQLQAETDFPITHLKIQAASDVLQAKPIVIDKTPEIIERLVRRYDCAGLTAKEREKRVLSPSALKRYTTCPLQFYYRYVEGIHTDEQQMDGFDASQFGNVFHRAAELLYKHLTAQGDVVRLQDIETMLELGGQRLESFVSQAFREKYFEGRAEEYTGILLIARQVLIKYLMQLLRYDQKIAPIRIIALEQHYSSTRHVVAGNREVEVEVGGIIDRLDCVNDDSTADGTLVRVVDYKTGGSPGNVVDFDNLFYEGTQNDQNVFQVMVYASIMQAQLQSAVSPCLFYVHKSVGDEYTPTIQIAKKYIEDVREPLTQDDEPLTISFDKRLQRLVDEVFNSEVPFRQTTGTKACERCDFRVLCGR